MSETMADEAQLTVERERLERLWRVADTARGLAETFSEAEEALDALEETDPPPRTERVAADEDDSMVASPDPMPPLYEDTPVEEDVRRQGPAPLTWGAVARLGLASASALLAGWAGAQLLATAPPPEWAGDSPGVLWLPGVLVSLAISIAAVSLRHARPSSEPPAADLSEARYSRTERPRVRWSAFAVTVLAAGTLTLAAVLGAWTLWVTGGQPYLAAMGAVVGTVVALAQVPARPPGPAGRPVSGAVLAAVTGRYRGARLQSEARATARRWRRARSSARAAIRKHTRAWQAVHHSCHAENELGNPQAEQLAHALIVLRGAMFGHELPGDSENSPDIPFLAGSLEVAVHNLTVYHPDRLTRRLRRVSEHAREEEA